MNFKKQIILFSILAMFVMAVSAEDISTYNPQVIEKHQITNEDIASATSYGQSLAEKKNIKMISTAKKKFIKRRMVEFSQGMNCKVSYMFKLHLQFMPIRHWRMLEV